MEMEMGILPMGKLRHQEGKANVTQRRSGRMGTLTWPQVSTLNHTHPASCFPWQSRPWRGTAT